MKFGIVISLLFFSTIPSRQIRAPLGNVDTAFLVSNATDVSGTNHFCNANLSGAIYECQILAVSQAGALAEGMVIVFSAQTVNNSTPSLDLQGLGPHLILMQDGVTPVVIGFFQVNVPHLLCFDGMNWRVLI